jgi:hypothetical protein
LTAIQKEFDDYKKEHPYKSFLPEDARPPLEINEEIMKRFRPAMEEHYLEIETE